MKKIWFLLIVVLLFVVACSNDSTNRKNSYERDSDPVTTTPNETVPNSDTEDDKSNEAKNVENQNFTFFPDDDVVIDYKGIGNEFASFQKKIVHLNDSIIYETENNGGTQFCRAYEVSNSGINLIEEKPECYTEEIPDASQFENMNETTQLFSFPIQEGDQSFYGTIVSVDESIMVQDKTYSNVMIVEKTSEDGSINRRYYASGIGEIKREFVSKDAPEEPISSELEQINAQ